MRKKELRALARRVTELERLAVRHKDHDNTFSRHNVRIDRLAAQIVELRLELAVLRNEPLPPPVWSPPPPPGHHKVLNKDAAWIRVPTGGPAW